TIEALVERLHDDPNNDVLKEEIRDFDLLARKAYFNSQWQVKTGAFLLLFGAIVFALGLRYYYSLKSKIEEPDQEEENEITGRILSQKWIIIAGVAVMVLALMASFATVDHLANYSLSGNTLASGSDPEDDGIEVVEVGTVNEVLAESSQKNSDSEEATFPLETENDEIDEVVSEQLTENPTTVSNSSNKLASSLTASQINANYNGFRGPWGNGVSNHKNVPTGWDGATGTNLLWKAEISKHGYNSPVIWGNKLFLSGGNSEAREVYCFDANTGELLWSKTVDNVPGSPTGLPRVTEDTGLAAPSVSTDGERVFAIFANGDIICFDINGNRLWARNLGTPDNHYGHSSSLITWAGKVFVQYDTNRGGKIMALNVTNGETVWETVRNASISWASPVLADVAGKKQIILSADPIVAGYDTETGEELWTVECMMGEVGPSVAVGEGLVFAANEYARLAAINPVDATIVWEDDYYLPEVASPVCANGLVVIATSYGILVCYDAKTGDLLWEEDYGTGFYASPIINDNKIYALDTDGVMHILELGREAKVLGSPELGEEGYATPAFAEGKIFIRGLNGLYCFGN
ncbi:MAG: PQQ-binding-like beta-propeller repeat protein, partial [Mariniphaga sp.]|nr:PQQ-binding-like beta-propeller repeat protein [Mariniphaga sp.]